MKHNSYVEMLDMIQDEGSKLNPPNIVYGIVSSVNPIQVVYLDLPLYESNLLIDKCIAGYTETVTIATETTSYTATITHPSLLTVGASVFLYEIQKSEKYALLGVV